MGFDPTFYIPILFVTCLTYVLMKYNSRIFFTYCVTFSDEGSPVMSVDSFTGDCALSGLFIGVMLTVSSGTVLGCDGRSGDR